MNADAAAALRTVLYFVSVLKVTPGRTFTCARCGHEELGAPVFLTTNADGRGHADPYGSGCAAVLLYGDARKAPRARKDAEAAIAAEDRRTRAAVEAARFEWFAATYGTDSVLDAKRATGRTIAELWADCPIAR